MLTAVDVGDLVIHVVQGDLLAVGAEAVVNPSNCVGAMGKGVAAAIRDAFPGCLDHFKGACAIGDVKPGAIVAFETGQATTRLVLHLPTKRHWRDASRMEDVIAGLQALPAACKAHGITRLAIPALGCGNGGLNWDEVGPRIFAYLLDCGLEEVWMFQPGA